LFFATVSGAAAAFVTGVVHMGRSLTCGAVLIVFYLSSSRLTKYKAAIKVGDHDVHVSVCVDLQLRHFDAWQHRHPLYK
jgi:hypothetical protein